MTATIAPRADQKVKIFLTNMQTYIEKVILLISDSAAEALITLLTWGISSAIIVNIVPPVLAARVIASMFMIYFVMFMIMLVRKFASHWTVDEVGERLIELDDQIKERLDRIIRDEAL